MMLLMLFSREGSPLGKRKGSGPFVARYQIERARKKVDARLEKTDADLWDRLSHIQQVFKREVLQVISRGTKLLLLDMKTLRPRFLFPKDLKQRGGRVHKPAGHLAHVLLSALFPEKVFLDYFGQTIADMREETRVRGHSS